MHLKFMNWVIIQKILQIFSIDNKSRNYQKLFLDILKTI